MANGASSPNLSSTARRKGARRLFFVSKHAVRRTREEFCLTPSSVGRQASVLTPRESSVPSSIIA